MPSNTNPWGALGGYGYTATAQGQKKLNPYYIPKYTQGEGTPTLDEKGRYYWDYGDPNLEQTDLSKMQDDGNGELSSSNGYVNLNGKRFLRVGDMWQGDPTAPKPTLSFDSYGPLTYDEKYGWLADAANLKEAPREDSFMDKYGLAVVAALGGMVAMPGIGAGVGGGSSGAAPAGIGTATLSPETIAALGAVDPASIAVAVPGAEAAAAGAGGLSSALSSGAGSVASEEQLAEAIRQLMAGAPADPAALQGLQTELLANSQFIDPSAWANMEAATGGLGNYSGAFDTGGWSGSGIFGDDSIWNSLKRFGSSALDKIPSIASALKAAGVGQPEQRSPMLSTSNLAGGGGSGGGGSAPRGNAPQFEQNPFAKLPQKVQAKTLADYLKG